MLEKKNKTNDCQESIRRIAKNDKKKFGSLWLLIRRYYVHYFVRFGKK